jgi:CO/xanthine dehydrogenase Mo-binding subunit
MDAERCASVGDRRGQGFRRAAIQSDAFRAIYSRPYLAHASIGPSCALAEWRETRLSVWSHTQGPFFLRENLARALDLQSKQIDVHTMGAGCYGHNGADDVALDAALLARSVDALIFSTAAISRRCRSRLRDMAGKY